MTEKTLHDVLIQIADELESEWENGERSSTVSLNDLTEILRRIAQDLPAPTE